MQSCVCWTNYISLESSCQVDHSHIISSFQCFDSNSSSLVFLPPEYSLLTHSAPWWSFLGSLWLFLPLPSNIHVVLKLLKTTFSVSARLKSYIPSVRVPLSRRWVPRVMLIQYGINSLIWLGMDMQTLSHRSLELEVKDAGSFCWPVGLRRCKCVSCGVDYLIFSWGTKKTPLFCRGERMRRTCRDKPRSGKDMSGVELRAPN